jgi:hypothetical protein
VRSPSKLPTGSYQSASCSDTSIASGLVNLVVPVPDQATEADHHRLGGLTVRALLEEGPHEVDKLHGLPKPHLIGHFNSLSSSPTQSHT